MATYQDYLNCLIYNKKQIPEGDFPPIANEAERLILNSVTQMIPEKYNACFIHTVCLLCNQLYSDYTEAKPTLETGESISSLSESSGSYSYSVNFEVETSGQKQAKYNKIIREGLTRCNGEFTGLFYCGVGGCK